MLTLVKFSALIADNAVSTVTHLYDIYIYMYTNVSNRLYACTHFQWNVMHRGVYVILKIAFTYKNNLICMLYNALHAYKIF